ncbi:MAG: glycosyltransferase family 4 protein [Verrucomicrobiia bacterium]
MSVRVAISTSVVQGGRSGVGQYVFGLLGALHARSPGLEILLLGLPGDRPLFEAWLDRFRWIPSPAGCRHPVADILWHQTALRRQLRHLGVQVLHVPSYRRIVWHPPCAQIATVHDCAAFAVRGKYSAARMFYGRHVVPALAANADRIVTVSDATADDVALHFRMPRSELRVVPNGIDHARFRPPDPAAVEVWRGNDPARRAPYFIYVARVEHPAKNHVRLVEAFEEFKRHTGLPHRLVFGGADWHGAEEVHRRVAASPFRADITAAGFVDAADLPFWYSGAEAMVYPSLFEGFGLPPVEAMACGCPVVCSGCGALAEVTGDAALRIDPLAPSEIAGALGRVAQDPALRARLREAGLRRAALYSWERAAAAMANLYLELAGPSPSAESRITA